MTGPFMLVGGLVELLYIVMGNFAQSYMNFFKYCESVPSIFALCMSGYGKFPRNMSHADLKEICHRKIWIQTKILILFNCLNSMH